MRILSISSFICFVAVAGCGGGTTTPDMTTTTTKDGGGTTTGDGGTKTGDGGTTTTGDGGTTTTTGDGGTTTTADMAGTTTTTADMAGTTTTTADMTTTTTTTPDMTTTTTTTPDMTTTTISTPDMTTTTISTPDMATTTISTPDMATTTTTTPDMATATNTTPDMATTTTTTHDMATTTTPADMSVVSSADAGNTGGSCLSIFYCEAACTSQDCFDACSENATSSASVSYSVQLYGCYSSALGSSTSPGTCASACNEPGDMGLSDCQNCVISQCAKETQNCATDNQQANCGVLHDCYSYNCEDDTDTACIADCNASAISTAYSDDAKAYYSCEIASFGGNCANACNSSEDECIACVYGTCTESGDVNSCTGGDCTTQETACFNDF